MNPWRAIAWTAVLLAATAQAAPPLPPPFERVGDAESIPDNNVTALAQDPHGFLWIGTPGGLIRYDGYRFRHFRGPGHAKRNAGTWFVRALHIAADGRVWIGHEGAGASVLDPRDGRVTPLSDWPEAPAQLKDGRVESLAEDRDGRLWFGTRNGLVSWHPQRGGAVSMHGALPSDMVWALLFDRRGGLWVGSATGLWWRCADCRKFSRVNLGMQQKLAEGGILALEEASDGSIWGTSSLHGVFRIAGDASSGAWLDGSGAVGSFFTPSALLAVGDQVWAGGLRGMAAFDLQGRLLWTRRDDRAGESEHIVDAGTLLRDDAGTVWSGGFAAGLLRHQAQQSAFRVLKSGTLGSANVGTMLELRNGELWVGTRGEGITRLDPQLRPTGLIDAAQGLHDGDVRVLMERDDATVFVGTRSGLYRRPPGSGAMEALRWSSDSRRAEIRALIEHRGDVWIGTTYGLNRLEAQRDVLVPVLETNGRRDFGNVNALAIDAQGRLWIGSGSSLLRLEPGEDALRAVTTAPDSPGQPGGGVAALLHDSRGRLWLDAGANGLHRITRVEGDRVWYQAIARGSGAGERPTGSLLEDERGRIWSQNYVYDPDSDTLHEIGRADGVDIGTAWFRSQRKLGDGRLLFGGSKGLLIIAPAQFMPWEYAPRVVASELRIDGQPLLEQTIAETVLRPDQRALTLEFAALDFSAPQRLRYRYRLDGLERDWNETTADARIASYGGLWPGSYTLRVQGSNRAGRWSPHELALPVRVLPAFWQTPWFAVLAMLALAGGVYASTRWRTAVARRRAEALEQIVAQRTRQLTDAQQQLVTQERLAALGTLTAGVAHEINNPTNFIAGAAQNLAVQMQQFRQFLGRLAGDDADATVLAAIDAEMHPQHEQLETILDGSLRITRIVADLRQFTRLDEAERKRIRLSEPLRSTVNLIRTRFDRITFELDLAIDPEIECQPAKIGQAFMNLVVNACEAVQAHRGELGGWVRLGSAIDGSRMVIGIEDNGGGMDEATQQRVFEPFFTTKGVGEGTGLGLAITLGIVREHGGTITVASEVGAGCRFLVWLPLTPGSNP